MRWEGGGWGRGGVAEAFSGKEGLNRWWLLRLTVKILAILRLTVKILAILRLTVTIIPSLSPQIFLTFSTTIKIYQFLRLKATMFWPFCDYRLTR